MKRKLEAIGLHAALIAAAILVAFPLYWMVVASFMPRGEAASFPPRLLPSTATLEHYRELFVRLNIGRAFLNSAIVATLSTLISLLFNSMAGYAFAKLRFARRETLFHFLLALLVLPAQVGMLPLFLMLKGMGLVNTYWGVVIPMMASVFGIFLIRQFMVSIPNELLEAARVDGATEWTIYRRIVLPLAMPVLVTLAIFTFMASWNDFMWPLIVLTDSDRYTLPVAIANLVGEHVQDVELMMAGAVITVIPVLLLFLFLQRYYVAGIMVGSVKG
ncbi:MAG TPA: carbohydrate ABC transporter permease [Thermoanaerobaculia bacterium]|nr:carbohydrate ABC transporter permease [Thermoanaerobaculia bacterium]